MKKTEVEKKTTNDIATIKDIPAIIFTFVLVLIPWIFFRAETAQEAVYIIKKITESFSLFEFFTLYPKRLIAIAFLVVIEWIQRRKEHPLCLDTMPRWLRYLIYYAIVVMILLVGEYNYIPFIYFQF